MGYDDGSVAIFRIVSSNSYPRSPSRLRPGRQQSSLGESSSQDEGGDVTGVGMSTSGPSLARHLHGHDRLGRPGDRGVVTTVKAGQMGQRTVLYPSGEREDIELVLSRR